MACLKSLQQKLLLVLLLATAAPLFAATTVDLSGAGWTFKPTLGDKIAVTVPHSWPASEQYRRYIGTAIYEHDFDAPATKPSQIVRLHFDAVYEHASVWLNGRHLGTHDGGYTPFEFEVTSTLKPGSNHLLVEVNNTPTIDSIPALATSNGPGSRNYPPYGTAAGEGIVGWMPYGGR
jgi:beta-glucuronidase